MDKNDLISRSALLSHAIPVYGKYDDSAEFEAVPVNYIKGAPTIDPEELRPRGKWIWNPNQQPIIDAVPVVRCRDCKWFDLYEMECINNAVSTDHEGGASYSLNFDLDDFCSFGERKE